MLAVSYSFLPGCGPQGQLCYDVNIAFKYPLFLV